MAILAGGASVRSANVKALKGKARVIAVNDAWQFAPWADLLYGADWPWWMHYQGVPAFCGEKWTQSQPSGGLAIQRTADLRLRVVRSAGLPGLSLDPRLIHQGGNSGFQAFNLAVLFGAARILLLGFDMGGKHWMRDRPKQFVKASPFDTFITAFEQSVPQLTGVEVVNCSTGSGLSCFTRMTLDQAIDAA